MATSGVAEDQSHDTLDSSPMEITTVFLGPISSCTFNWLQVSCRVHGPLSLYEYPIFEDPRDSQQPNITLPEVIEFLNAVPSNRAAVKRALLHIIDCLKKGTPYGQSVSSSFVDALVGFGVVPAVVKYLRMPDSTKGDSDDFTEPYQYEVEKKCAQTLGLLAVKPEHQQLIIDAGALPRLVDFLMRHKISTISCPFVGLLRRVADAIHNLASENIFIKTLVRMEGGIPPLVELLEVNFTKVQRAAAWALASLAHNNDDNKKQIVECNALLTLVQMLQSEDRTIHYVAVVVIKNLVHSSPDIMKEVLLAGALQPVISLLSSRCWKTQKQAAHLIGQFAATDSDCKVQISQSGVIQQLVDMLKSPIEELGEMSVFALGSLAPESHNQAIIAYEGIEPLLNIIDSNKAPHQHYAVLALCGLADNEGLAANIIKAGGFEKLKDGHFKYQPTKQCAATTLKRLEEKMQGEVLKDLIYVMRCEEKGVQIRVAIALAYLCFPHDCKTIFIDNNGLQLLLDILESPSVKQKGDASAALRKLVAKVSSFVSLFDATLSPTPRMYLGEEYVNNAKLSDVTFLVEGRSFYAHRDCLISSDVFRAMFDGNYREREAKHIVIPDISWGVFELMMRYIYTGTVDVNLDIVEDLLRAADQYLLDGLKSICGYAIARDISVENVALMYKMSEDFNATALKQACIMFLLENFFRLRSIPWYCRMVHRIKQDIPTFFSTLFIKTCSTDSRTTLDFSEEK